MPLNSVPSKTYEICESKTRMSIIVNTVLRKNKMQGVIQHFSNIIAGRTGRAGTAGHAVSFLTLDCKIAEELKQLLEDCGQVRKKVENFGSQNLIL